MKQVVCGDSKRNMWKSVLIKSSGRKVFPEVNWNKYIFNSHLASHLPNKLHIN